VRRSKVLLVAGFVGVLWLCPGLLADVNDLSAYYGFEEMEMIKLDGGICCLRTGDFNADGRRDIAVVNNRRARIELLLQKEEIGPADAQVTVDPEDADVNLLRAASRFHRQSLGVSQEIFGFVCGDLNSDGLVDLAYYARPEGLYVMLQKPGGSEAAGDFETQWRTSKKIDISDGLPTPEALVCADLNNDGTKDLALAGRDGIYIVTQKTDGSLSEPRKYPTASRCLSLKAGDLDGDGINDLVLLTDDTKKPVHVRFGLSTGQLGPQERFFIEPPSAFILYDIDGQAGSEILTIDAGSHRLLCYALTGAGKKNSDWPILSYPLVSGKGYMKRDLATGDFDGDGWTDVVISDGGAAELLFYRQIPDIGLVEPVRFPAYADIDSLSAGDIDADGRAELAVLSVKEKVIGLSEFAGNRLSFPEPLAIGAEPLAMELADVDGDGRLDCVCVAKDSNDTRFLKIIEDVGRAGEGGTAGGEAKDEGQRGLELGKLKSDPDGLKVVDVDQDGLADVLLFVKYELPVLVRQKRDGGFEVIDSPRSQSSLIKHAELRSIAVADVDGQAGQELLVAQSNFARSLVFSQAGAWKVVDQYNARSRENTISAVAAFDLDAAGGQGRPAILLLDGQKGRLQILKSGADKTYRLEQEVEVGKWNAADHLKLLFLPFTGGQRRSILLFDSEKFALVIPPSDTRMVRGLERRFAYETKIKDGKYGRLTAGDINSDGYVDVTLVEFNRRHIEILAVGLRDKPVVGMRFKLFEEKSFRNRKSGSQAGIEPRELTVAEVTGDGRDDLVTIIHDRVIVYPQD